MRNGVLTKGQWVLTNNLKISRLTDKIELLYWRHKRAELNETQKWWPILKAGIDNRNKITHPKEEVTFSDNQCEKIIQAVIDCVGALYLAVYKTKFPKSHLLITSKLDF